MGIINNIFGAILSVIFDAVSLITPLGALAIAIIIFTLVARILLTPLQLSSQRTSRGMSKIQPELLKIQNKYKGRKDQESQMKQSQEMQALYKKYKINPFAGCLPLIIQFPLIMGLFNVLRTPANYITKLGEEYTNIANIVMANVANYQDKLQSFQATIEATTRTKFDLTNTTQLGQYLSHLTTGQWNSFINSSGDASTQELLTNALNLKHQYENFLGFNVVDSPSALMSTQWWAILIPIVAGASTYIFTKLTMASNGQMQAAAADGQANPGESMMKTMNIVMPIMTGAFAYTMPIGLALYWIAGNVIMLVQQKIVNKMLEKQDAKIEAMLEKEREEARKNNKTYTKKVMKKVPIEKQPEAKTNQANSNEAPKTYTKKVIKKVPVQKKSEE
ncbi:MAG: YidC/Oxa1 family membrane protein insertase [Candidatus Cellulosilyticum pullistercoris]|uniref:YidC/Oxa1 family membrane protein insertase n=1 Tax=Candidatus Cellulosilyticum pullistercoris TaxID=2838521 RepID=A0A9E2NLX3_9FIRM|nr:YidC/Oxa1 family membrane protein insertase [Candidatus Cellulosilyticum pullistercoris]